MDQQELDDAIVRMRKEGHIMNDIALELRCGAAYVKTVLDRNKLSHQDLLEQKRQKIRTLWDQGMQPAEIAAQVGAHISYVYEICRGRPR